VISLSTVSRIRKKAQNFPFEKTLHRLSSSLSASAVKRGASMNKGKTKKGHEKENNDAKGSPFKYFRTTTFLYSKMMKIREHKRTCILDQYHNALEVYPLV
jgi:hypothetical protein